VKGPDSNTGIVRKKRKRWRQRKRMTVMMRTRRSRRKPLSWKGG
jgi:hypothetical protein